MLMTALRLGDECMRQQALSCIENIIKNSLNPANGLPYEAYSDGKWSVNGWWFDGMHTPGHSSYLIGQSLFYILKAYDYEKRLKNCLHEDWMAFVKEVLMKVEKTKILMKNILLFYQRKLELVLNTIRLVAHGVWQP